MKRLLTLIALLGLAVGVFAGCNQSGTDAGKTDTSTNAPPPAANTNK